MILRRVTEHVKAQNWFAVGVDFVIVVVGVFIGIQVANWNESRLEQERARLSRTNRGRSEGRHRRTGQASDLLDSAGVAEKRPNFLAELKRRNVIRMAGLYLVGGWLVVQIAETLLLSLR
jgi:hypothetical protein